MDQGFFTSTVVAEFGGWVPLIPKSVILHDRNSVAYRNYSWRHLWMMMGTVRVFWDLTPWRPGRLFCLCLHVKSLPIRHKPLRNIGRYLPVDTSSWISISTIVWTFDWATSWTVRDRNSVGTNFPPVQTGSGGPPSLLYNGYRVFPGGKVRPGRAADHSPPSIAAVMEE
jgi:hypothetical protein